MLVPDLLIRPQLETELHILRRHRDSIVPTNAFPHMPGPLHVVGRVVPSVQKSRPKHLGAVRIDRQTQEDEKPDS